MFILALGFPPDVKCNALPEAATLVVSIARQIFDCQRSDFFEYCFEDAENQLSVSGTLTFGFFARFLVGLDRLELSTSPLSGARSSHLSYRPVDQKHYTAPGHKWG
jgi:hypothetical protein